ncbi:hypothetical protein ElyMa_003536400 [Elysia marginata]|uniref:Protein phosphatase 1 regulatory subunit 35 C-terminal domain-containing protein n=1 Tax=Elysia marginata TaxID=1093978 RepID=A0AAV4EIP2_9GAST|nr:hypothetical protein ElyMa_003536400 [Elysia marginata]
MEKEINHSDAACSQKVLPGIPLDKSNGSSSTRFALPQRGLIITQPITTLEITPIISFSNATDKRSEATRAPMPDQVQAVPLRPLKKAPTLQKLKSQIMQEPAVDSKASRFGSETLTPSLNETTDPEDSTSVTDLDKEMAQRSYEKVNFRNTYYLDTSRQLLGNKNAGCHDIVLQADAKADEPRVSKDRDEEVYGKYQRYHDNNISEHFIQNGTSKDKLNISNHQTLLDSLRWENNITLYKRQLGVSKDRNFFESLKKKRCFDKENADSMPRNSVESVQKAAGFDIDRIKPLERDLQDTGLGGKDSHLVLPYLEPGTRRPHQPTMPYKHGSIFPQRKLPFISRLEILEELFFSRTSNAQSMLPHDDVHPELDISLPEVTISTAGNVSSLHSSCCSPTSQVAEEYGLHRLSVSIRHAYNCQLPSLDSVTIENKAVNKHN